MSKAIIAALKQEDQDFEWYPTTREMVEAIKKHIPADAKSLMDIGAGDGRVLAMLKEKCEHALLYSIEKSPILLQAQPGDIIPVGTDLWEQNLSTLPVDYIICNPTYRNFVEWVFKIVSQGYARKAFLIIPQRWKDDKMIQEAIKDRGADTDVIYSGDFIAGDRQSRAVIDIVEVRFRSTGRGWQDIERAVEDPFDAWFDRNIKTFDVEKEIIEPQSVQELARKYKDNNIADLVQAYRDEYDHLEKHYQSIFQLDANLLRELGITHENVREGLKKKMKGLKIKYWSVLFKRLDAITSRLTTKSAKIILDKMTARNTIEFTETNAYAVVLWAIKNANQYVDDQAVELFYDLATFDGVENYKSNLRTWEKSGWRYNGKEHTHYKLDYRIVVNSHGAIYSGQLYSSYYKSDLHENAHDMLADVIAVFATLGFKTNSEPSFDRKWYSGKLHEWYCEDDDTILFQVRAYKNGNLHFKFKPEAIQALNIMVGRILKWVRTVDEVVEEMGYSRKDAMRFFNHNPQIPISNVPRLMSGEPVQPVEIPPEPKPEPKPKPERSKSKPKPASLIDTVQEVDLDDLIRNVENLTQKKLF